MYNKKTCYKKKRGSTQGTPTTLVIKSRTNYKRRVTRTPSKTGERVKSRDTDNIGQQVKNKQKDDKNGLLQTLERSETMCSRRLSSSPSEYIVGERGKNKSQ